MKHRILSLALCLISALTLAGCDGGQAPESSAQQDAVTTEESPSPSQPEVKPGPLAGVDAENYPRVDGSTANMPLMAQLYSVICGIPSEEAESFVTASGGTGAVWRSMMYGSADLLLVYEAPEIVKRDMQELETPLELEITPLGCDGLVFLVNKQNPVDSLTIDQLRGIYTGKITDWSEVGGDAGPIAPFQRNEESDSQTLFQKLLMGNTEPMQAPTELVPGSMGGLIEGIAAFDGAGGAIGYSVYYYANLMYASPDLKLLKVDGVGPSTESIGAKEYPLVNDFYVVIRADAEVGSPARLLRDWLLTDEGTQVLTAANYIPVEADEPGAEAVQSTDTASAPESDTPVDAPAATSSAPEQSEPDYEQQRTELTAKTEAYVLKNIPDYPLLSVEIKPYTPDEPDLMTVIDIQLDGPGETECFDLLDQVFRELGHHQGDLYVNVININDYEMSVEW